jgi:hypothetical protein
MCIAFELPLPIGMRIGAAVFVLGTAMMAASPMREGIWIGTYSAIHLLRRWFVGEMVDGQLLVKEEAPRQGRWKWIPRVSVPMNVKKYMLPPQGGEVAAGLFAISPGGWRAMLKIEGPPCAIDSNAYASWCQTVMAWIRSLDVPAQFVTVVGHVNREQAEGAFDEACSFEPTSGPLVRQERAFAGETAVRALSFSHYLVLAPRMCGANGLPSRFGPTNASRSDAEHALAQAMSAAKSNGLSAEVASADGIEEVLATSSLGNGTTKVSGEGVLIGRRQVASLVVTRLGADCDFGMLVEVIQRSGMQGAVSMHLLPVSRAIVRQQLNRRRLWLRYAMREGRPDVDLEVSLQDTEHLQAELAAGRTEGLRIALSIRILAATNDEASESVERLRSIFAGHGWGVELVTVPQLLPAFVGAPGVAPLRRGILLTTDAVAARILPALGTPFAAVGDPIVGTNLRAGSSAYLSVFSRPNFNAVIVGSSGSGKSVAAKTLLARHVMRGAGAVVLDPDSEYRDLVKLLGGEYYELPQASLNPLALGADESCDLAAGRIVPVLSVMAGDDTEYVGGRPIRRLPNEDKAWLHSQLRAFLLGWRESNQGEPLLREFIYHLEDQELTDRASRIVLRLKGFTQGQVGEIFDRPSSFCITSGQVVGVGFKQLSLAYAADLTPALCVVLSHVLDAIANGRERMVILVDEAHVLTSDPDAGQVLEQLVRRARKCKAGVWMASQRIEEFTSTELGKTLASTAATKLILGVEDTVAERTRQIFELADDEIAALTPPVPGRAVLIAGSERTIVQIQPSPILWPFVSTSAEDAVA